MRGSLSIVTGSILVSVADPALSQQRDSYAHGHMWDTGGWFMGPIFMLLLLAAIVAIVLFLIKHAGGSIKGAHTAPIYQKETALEMLKIRYAKGEIDHEEYDLRRKKLES